MVPSVSVTAFVTRTEGSVSGSVTLWVLVPPAKSSYQSTVICDWSGRAKA